MWSKLMGLPPCRSSDQGAVFGTHQGAIKSARLEHYLDELVIPLRP
jgi:hypothetical protein